jgi:hypothetical protein
MSLNIFTKAMKNVKNRFGVEPGSSLDTLLPTNAKRMAILAIIPSDV